MVNGMRITFQSSLINTVGFNLKGKQSNLERMLSLSNFHSSAPKVASRVCGRGVWFIYTWRRWGDGSSMYPGASANFCYRAAGWGWAAPELVAAGEGLGLFLGLLLLCVADVHGQDNSWSIHSLLFRTLWAPLLTLPCLSSRGVVDHPETFYGSYVFLSRWHQLSGPPPRTIPSTLSYQTVGCRSFSALGTWNGELPTDTGQRQAQSHLW